MKRALALGAPTVVGTALIAWWAALHEAPLLIGTTPQATLVPWWYQTVAFPPFLLLLASFLVEPRAPWGRLTLLGASSLLAVVRLAGFIPLSGHAVFLAACVAAVAGGRRFAGAPAVMVTAALGLAVTAFAKWRWGDLGWFSVSVVVGAALGLAARRLEPQGQFVARKLS